MLLQARGPEIDRIAPLRLDLDFLDTTGYVVLPVESQALLVDCTTSDADMRPIEEMSLTQTLDERQAKDGRLILEIKATAQGVVPELDEIAELKFADFEVKEIEDNGVAVARFDPESRKPVIVSDRLWTVTLEDKDSAAKIDRQFDFASAKLPLKEELWQRYDDADLVEVEQTVVLAQEYDKPQWSSSNLIAIAVAAGLFVFAVIAAVVVFVLRKMPAETVSQGARFNVPSEPTPFNVLMLLKDIERNNGFAPEAKDELATSITRIERSFFADESPADVDLSEVANTWVRRAK